MAQLYQPGAIKDDDFKFYGGNSKIIDGKADKTAAAWITGLGNFFDQGITAIDTTIKEGIKTDWYNKYDATNAANGVDAYVNETGGGQVAPPLVLDPNKAHYAQGSPQQGSPPLNISPSDSDVVTPQSGLSSAGLAPPNLNRHEYSLSRLNAAHKAGRITDTMYYAQLEMAVRELRAQNPGYREYIDQLVQKTTGITPANALRRAVQNDLDKAQQLTQQGQNDQRKLFESKSEWMPPEIYQGAKSGKITYDQAISVAQRNEAFAKRQAVQAATMAAAKANNEYNQDEAKRTISGQLAQQGASILTDADTAGGISKMIKTMIEKATPDASGKIQLSPEDTQKASLALQEFKMSVNKKMHQIMYGKVEGQNRSNAEILGDPKLVQSMIEEQVKSIVGPFEDALTKGDFALLNTHMTQAKMITEGAKSALLREDIAQKVSAVRSVFGDPGMNFILSDSGGLPAVVNLIKSHIKADVTNNSVRGVAIEKITQKVIKDLKELPVEDQGKALRGLLDDLKNAKADTPKEITDALLKVFTSPDMSKEMRRMNNQEKLYMLKNFGGDFLDKIKSTSTPETFQRYKDFVKERFLDLYKTSFDGLKEDQIYNKNATIIMEPQFGLLIYQPTKEGLEEARRRLKVAYANQSIYGISGPSQPTDAQAEQYWRENIASPSIQQQIDQVNQGITATKKIFEDDKTDSKKFLEAVYNRFLTTPHAQEVSGFAKLLKSFGFGQADTKEPADKSIERLDVSSFTKGSGSDAQPGTEEEQLRKYVVKGTGAERPDSFSSLDKNFRAKLIPFINAAKEAGVISGEDVFISGYRSKAIQAGLKARGGFVGTPESSLHPKGLAIDLHKQNEKFMRWAYKNAGKYGFHFPYGAKDPNHMELIPSDEEILNAPSKPLAEKPSEVIYGEKLLKIKALEERGERELKRMLKESQNVIDELSSPNHRIQTKNPR